MTTESPLPKASQKPSRFPYIDQYRGWAVLLMIEAHVLNTFLQAGFRETAGFKVADFLNGLVAPSFLFLAGFSFAISAGRRWNELTHLGPGFWKQLLRSLFILLVGYALRMPHYSFRVLFFNLKWSENGLFWGVDILHCIAISLIFMLLSLLLVRSQKYFLGFLTAALLAISFVSPMLQARPLPPSVPAPLAGYLKRILYSPFPLFPWMGYVVAGALFSFLWQRSRSRDKEKAYFAILLSGAGILGFITSLTLVQPRLLFGAMTFSPVYPQFFFLKLALVLMLLCLFRWLQEKRQDRPRPVTRLGQESLLGYVFHIVIIFGPFWKGGRYALSYVIGKRCTPLQIVIMALPLMAVTILACLAWHALKKSHPRLARPVHLAAWGVVILFFLLH